VRENLYFVPATSKAFSIISLGRRADFIWSVSSGIPSHWPEALTTISELPSSRTATAPPEAQ